MKLISRLLVVAVAALMVLSNASEVAQAKKSDEIDPISAAAAAASGIVYQIQVDNYIAGIQRAQEEAAAAEAARVAEEAAIAEAARKQQQQVQRPVQPQVQSNVTGVCGGATNGADQFIQRESGGNPNIYNTGGSGAWGCYQIMPGTWAGAGCNELGQHGSASPEAQAACASRLNLSAWR